MRKWTERTNTASVVPGEQRTRVLVTDDDPEQLLRYAKELRDAGFSVVTLLAHLPGIDKPLSDYRPPIALNQFDGIYSSHEGAQEQLHKHVPQVDGVLSDYQLGVCHGYDIVRWAQAVEPRKRVVVHTSDLNLEFAWDTERVREVKTRCLGAYGVIGKDDGEQRLRLVGKMTQPRVAFDRPL